jgi:hypothetical protein
VVKAEVERGYFGRWGESGGIEDLKAKEARGCEEPVCLFRVVGGASTCSGVRSITIDKLLINTVFINKTLSKLSAYQ